MKSSAFRLVVPLIVVAAVFLRTGGVEASEVCPVENCLPSEKCEVPVTGSVTCANGNTCCSIVKSEYRTHCRHYGGECMMFCNPSLMHNTVDCSNGQTCCVLV